MADVSGAVPLGTPPPGSGIPITVNAGIGPGPDGGPCGGVSIVQGPCSFTFMVTEARAPELARILVVTMQRLEVELRRARLGLIVPQNGQG